MIVRITVPKKFIVFFYQFFQVDELKEKLKKCERTITEYNDKTETRFRETKSLKDIILENNKKIDELNMELSKTKQKYKDFLVQVQSVYSVVLV